MQWETQISYMPGVFTMSNNLEWQKSMLLCLPHAQVFMHIWARQLSAVQRIIVLEIHTIEPLKKMKNVGLNLNRNVKLFLFTSNAIRRCHFVSKCSTN